MPPPYINSARIARLIMHRVFDCPSHGGALAFVRLKGWRLLAAGSGDPGTSTPERSSG
jgi:hypothetical protein